MEENTQKTNKEKIELTILMPCLNESSNIGYSLRAATDFLLNNNISGEIIVVDNDSSDNSADIASSFGARVITESHKGYGKALRTGIKHAAGTYTIMGDCDSTYDFRQLMPFLIKLRSGCDLVVGNRFSGNIESGAMPFLHRYLGIPFLSFLGRKKYHVEIHDFHCGIRGFKTKAAQKLPLKCNGMEFATEIIACFAKTNARIAEVPATLSVSRSPRNSHLRSIQDGARHLVYMLKN